MFLYVILNEGKNLKRSEKRFFDCANAPLRMPGNMRVSEKGREGESEKESQEIIYFLTLFFFG